MRRWTSIIWGALLGLLALVVTACGASSSARISDERATVGILRLVPTDVQDVFEEELKAQGWNPERNVQILPSDPEQLFSTPAEAREALRKWQRDDLDLVIAFSTPYAQLVADETDIPGLFVVNDPVAGGLTTDLHNPDGQFTGLTWQAPADRTLHLASQLLGGVSRIGYLGPTDDPAVAGHRANVLGAADRLGIEVVEEFFAGTDDVPRAVDQLAGARPDAVYIDNANATAAAIDELREEFDRRHIPVIANVPYVDFAVVTLAPDTAELHRQLARQAARVLDGIPVSSIPGEHPRRFVVTIDRTRAQQFGYDVDTEALRQADVVR